LILDGDNHFCFYDESYLQITVFTEYLRINKFGDATSSLIPQTSPLVHF
jgi:hypothetical protein